jgi:SAM-dependent methyltransferase
MAISESPDRSSLTFLDVEVDPHRYDWQGVFGADDLQEAPAIMSRWVPSDGAILDVGCGGGAISVLIGRGRTGTMLGVEPDAIRAETARARGLDVVTGVLDGRLLAERGPFDAILFTDVLEHLVAPGEILALAATGLRPGGCIIASVPNVAHWTVRFRLLLGRFDYRESGIMDATHLRWFTRKSFVSLFERHGFKIVKLDASSGIWLSEYSRFPFKFLPRGLRRWLINSLSRSFPGLFGAQHIVKAELSADMAQAV